MNYRDPRTGRFVSKQKYNRTIAEQGNQNTGMGEENQGGAGVVQNFITPFRIEPSKFSGAPNEDVRDWFNSFERICIANDFNDARRFSVLPAFFVEEASRFYSSCPAEVIQDYESVKKAFFKEFGGISDPLLLRHTWDNRWQTKEESVKEYVRALQQLVKRVFPVEGNITAAEQDKKLRLQFTHHAQYAIRDAILREEPTTFAKALQIAKDAESKQSILISSQPSSAVGSSSIATTSWAGSPFTTAVQKRIDTLEKSLATVTETLNQVHLALQRPQVQYPPAQAAPPFYPPMFAPNFPRGGNPPRMGGPCWNCNQLGHRATQCPYPPGPHMLNRPRYRQNNPHRGGGHGGQQGNM